MTRTFRTFALAAAAAALMVALPSAQTASLKSDFIKEWTGQKSTLVKIAEAMPEAKFSFKATPPQRDFGGHVMHIAQINMMVLKTLGAAAAAPAINDKATSKADTIKAMSDSFDYGTALLEVLKARPNVVALRLRFGMAGPRLKSIVIVPAVAGSSPEMTRSSVVFPAPFEPITATASPACTVIDTPNSA